MKPPPIGVMPCHLWEELHRLFDRPISEDALRNRVVALADVIKRYAEDGRFDIKTEWYSELAHRCSCLKVLRKKSQPTEPDPEPVIVNGQ
jgi:hypothetical protein